MDQRVVGRHNGNVLWILSYQDRCRGWRSPRGEKVRKLGILISVDVLKHFALSSAIQEISFVSIFQVISFSPHTAISTPALDSYVVFPLRRHLRQHKQQGDCVARAPQVWGGDGSRSKNCRSEEYLAMRHASLRESVISLYNVVDKVVGHCSAR